MLEAGLTLMIVLMVIIGVMEVGRAVWAYNYVAALARAGSRFAIVRGTSGGSASEDDIRTYVRSQVVGLNPTSVNVAVSWTPSKAPGSTVAVAVTYSVDWVAPFLPDALAVGSTSKAVIAE